MESLLSWIRRILSPASAFSEADAVLAARSATANSGIVAAKVVKAEKHPNADRLRVVELDIGQKRVGPVVCGAFNFRVGDMVAFALPGATIPKNIHSQEHEAFVLSKAKIRGVESQGMICAAFELGLSHEQGMGIAILKKGINPGSQFSEEMIE